MKKHLCHVLRKGLCLGLVVAATLSISSAARAQAPSVLYTWDNTGNPSPNIESWVKNFGTNTATITNAIFGELTLTETGLPGSTIAFSDGGNRVRESATGSSGGTDVTGLDWLEFDLGHSGIGDIGVQFYVQASTGFNYVTLANLQVSPGVSTYQVPLTGLTPAQSVYLRTIGFNVFDHAAEGNVTWTLREVRAGGTPLSSRDLITHETGTGDGGLQTAIVNFDRTAVLGNNGSAANQVGLSHNPAGTGSLQWTDLGGSEGAAIGWGNGTAWNGNTFNSRTTDVSNYKYVTFTVSATDPLNGGGTIGMAAYIQANNFVFQGIDGGSGQSIPIDGQFHDVTWSLAGMNNMNAVDLVGLNLFGHPQDLIMNVDNIRFYVPEPATCSLIGLMLGCLGLRRKVSA